MINYSGASIHLGVGGSSIFGDRLKYISRSKVYRGVSLYPTGAYIVCAIAIALSILWEM